MPTFTLVVDPHLLDGTPNTKPPLLIAADRKIVGPNGIEYDTREQEYTRTDGVPFSVVLRTPGTGYYPSAWNYRVRVGTSDARRTVPANQTGTVYLSDFTPTTPGVYPPDFEQRLNDLTARVAELEAGGGGGGGGGVPVQITAPTPSKTDQAGTADDVLTLPDHPNYPGAVIWRVNLVNYAPGDHPAAAIAGYPNFTVTAVAAPGYALTGTTVFPDVSFGTGGGTPTYQTILADTMLTGPWDGSPHAPTTAPAGYTWTVNLVDGISVVDGWLKFAHRDSIQGDVLDTGSTTHYVEADYDLASAQAGSAFDQIEMKVGAAGAYPHTVALKVPSGGGKTAVVIDPPPGDGSWALSPVGGADLTNLPLTGTMRLAFNGVSVTLSVNGTTVGSAAATTSGGSTGRTYAALSNVGCYSGNGGAFVKVRNVVIKAQA